MNPHTDPMLYRGLTLLEKFETPFDCFKYWATAGKWRRDEPQIENCGNWMHGLGHIFRHRG